MDLEITKSSQYHGIRVKGFLDPKVDGTERSLTMGTVTSQELNLKYRKSLIFRFFTLKKSVSKFLDAFCLWIFCHFAIWSIKLTEIHSFNSSDWVDFQLFLNLVYKIIKNRSNSTDSKELFKELQLKNSILQFFLKEF